MVRGYSPEVFFFFPLYLPEGMGSRAGQRWVCKEGEWPASCGKVGEGGRGRGIGDKRDMERGRGW